MKLLEWKKYDLISNSTFENLYEDELFTDVTLACEGNKKLKAHKVILIACSNLLKEILQDNQHPHPLIYLQGLDFENLILLKKFMYLGKAMIEQENIQTFVNVSTNFLNTETEKIPHLVPKTSKFTHYDTDGIIDTSLVRPENLVKSALTENSVATEGAVNVEEYPKESYQKKILNPINFDAISTPYSLATSVPINEKLPIQFIARMKQSCLSCEYKTFDLDKLKDHSDKMHLAQICPKCGISLEGKLQQHLKQKHTTYSCKECSFTTEVRGQYHLHKKSHITDSLLRCDQCEYTSYFPRSVKRHGEIHNTSKEFKCESCDFMSKTFYEQKNHNNKVHKGLRFECEECDYSATNSNNLKTHKLSVHEKVKMFCRFCTFSDSLISRVKLHEKRKHSEEIKD